MQCHARWWSRCPNFPPSVLVLPGNSVPGNFEDVASAKRGEGEGPGLPPVISSRQFFIFLFSNHPSERGGGGGDSHFSFRLPLLRKIFYRKNYFYVS
jgi:hypothetical protein